MSKKPRNEAEALKETIAVWKEIVKGKLTTKPDLPSEVYDTIKDYTNECPLCELYIDPLTNLSGFENCHKCPLGKMGSTCGHESSPYDRWCWGLDEEEMHQGAKDLLAILEIYQRNWNLV